MLVYLVRHGVAKSECWGNFDKGRELSSERIAQNRAVFVKFSIKFQQLDIVKPGSGELGYFLEP